MYGSLLELVIDDTGHQGSGEVCNGRMSLEVARLGKHEVSLADTQKAVQDAVQVSKSFLASSCCPKVLFCIDQPCTDVSDTLGHLKWMDTFV